MTNSKRKLQVLVQSGLRRSSCARLLTSQSLDSRNWLFVKQKDRPEAVSVLYSCGDIAAIRLET